MQNANILVHPADAPLSVNRRLSALIAIVPNTYPVTTTTPTLTVPPVVSRLLSTMTDTTSATCSLRGILRVLRRISYPLGLRLVGDLLGWIRLPLLVILVSKFSLSPLMSFSFYELSFGSRCWHIYTYLTYPIRSFFVWLPYRPSSSNNTCSYKKTGSALYIPL